MKLKNKTAIVTGGGRDIGRACAMRLAAEGANVVINYFSSSAGADSAVEEIVAKGGKAIAMQGDLSTQAGAEALVAKTVETFGGLDILVNNTGGLVARKGLAEMDEEFFEHVMKLNVTSTFLTTKAVAPKMKAGSSIVNLASQAGRDGGGPGAAAYASSKGAVMTFTRAMAKELGPNNIRVNCVCPGMIDTTFHDTFTKNEVRKNVAAGTTLRREGEAAEVADLVAYLASSESSFLNGASIDINGGTIFS